MKSILYINGSPRGETLSNSSQILKDIDSLLNEGNLMKKKPPILTLSPQMNSPKDSVLKKMDEADIWILVLPLYVDSLPGHLTWWLKQYELYRAGMKKKHRIQVYGIINCGFPEAIQNADALMILEIFCKQNGLDWRFGIGIGKGGPYRQMKDIPLHSFMKSRILHAFQTLSDDLSGKEERPAGNLYVSIRIPRFLYSHAGSTGWKLQAKKNGLCKKDLFARPLTDVLSYNY